MSTQVHTVNFLQKVFRSAVNNNQIFPLDVVKIINNERLEMENKMYSRRYNVINIINKYKNYIVNINEKYINDLADEIGDDRNKNYYEILKNINRWMDYGLFYIRTIEEHNIVLFGAYPKSNSIVLFNPL